MICFCSVITKAYALFDLFVINMINASSIMKRLCFPMYGQITNITHSCVFHSCRIKHGMTNSIFTCFLCFFKSRRNKLNMVCTRRPSLGCYKSKHYRWKRKVHKTTIYEGMESTYIHVPHLAKLQNPQNIMTIRLTNQFPQFISFVSLHI
jgi:hypothetical protein